MALISSFHVSNEENGGTCLSVPTATTKLSVLISASLLASAPVFAARGAAGNGNAGRGGPQPGRGPASVECDLSGPGQGTPRRDGSGKVANQRGNPNSNGTPLKDGSGKATAPGKGSKDGTGNRANCPVVPPAN
jgi:hypothetical protein